MIPKGHTNSKQVNLERNIWREKKSLVRDDNDRVDSDVVKNYWTWSEKIVFSLSNSKILPHILRERLCIAVTLVSQRSVMASMSRFTSLHANVTLHFTRFGDMNVTSHVSVIWMSRHQCHGNVTLHFTSHQCHASLHFTPMSRFTSLHANVTLHFTRFGDMNVTWTWMSQCHCDMNVTGMSMSRECQCHAVNVTHVVKPSAAKAERSGNGGAAVSPARLWYPLTFIYSYNAKNKSIGKTFFFLTYVD